MTFVDYLVHDLLLTRRSKVGRTVFAALGLAPLAGVGLSFVLSNDTLTARFVLLSMWLVVSGVVPIVAILGSAAAISGNRESGRLRLVLGSPTAQADVFFGTFAARLLLVQFALLVGLSVAVALMIVLSLPMALGRLGGFLLFTPLMATAYVSLGVAASTTSRTQLRSLSLGVAAFVATLAWPQAATVLADVFESLSGITLSDTLVHFVGTLSPFGAYAQAIGDGEAIYGMAASTPLLRSGAMGLVLLLWVVAPLVFGYQQFVTADV
ncbi:ABC transporter permease [Haloglomus litoreum]|uniref:ABC transporter permease n=1 Tax=Haloglomus litoreum TaxID=3034026 RepID=UPI0023E8968F|nr:ABC transporter permease subunit [Haloglomus sp. DT116]